MRCDACVEIECQRKGRDQPTLQNAFTGYGGQKGMYRIHLCIPGLSGQTIDARRKRSRFQPRLYEFDRCSYVGVRKIRGTLNSTFSWAVSTKAVVTL